MVCGTIVPESITVADGVVTITLPATFDPISGGLYNIPLRASIPEGTNGAVINITNGTVTGALLNAVGSNVRLGPLNAQWVLRVQFFADPDHFNLLRRTWRAV